MLGIFNQFLTADELTLSRKMGNDSIMNTMFTSLTSKNIQTDTSPHDPECDTCFTYPNYKINDPDSCNLRGISKEVKLES
jgi:hypothetical protein